MPADEVARIGLKAMMAGEGDVVAGPKNKSRPPWRRSLRLRGWLNSTERWPSRVPRNSELSGS
jgi:hypothetical protein